MFRGASTGIKPRLGAARAGGVAGAAPPKAFREHGIEREALHGLHARVLPRESQALLREAGAALGESGRDDVGRMRAARLAGLVRPTEGLVR